ncbi:MULTISPECIES: hypothetical protein [unclassified Bacillus cereus group]|uniref:hypothetical protein n=1 Tax=Bacillus cereus group TaxID=86661 RepID=UPI001F5A4884
MLPTKEQLIQHLFDKMTNQDIAEIYGISFQKVIQLIKKNKMNLDELRKVYKYIVYEHWFDNEAVYVGSGVWYRCRRYTNIRNSEHRQLMQDGNIDYKIVGEFDKEEEARDFEVRLIKKYKQLGLAKFNKQVN